VCGDRICEINKKSLHNVEFIKAQAILRDTLIEELESNDDTKQIELKISRTKKTIDFEPSLSNDLNNDDFDEATEERLLIQDLNEPKIQFIDATTTDGSTSESDNRKPLNQKISENNHQQLKHTQSSSLNINATNTKKLGNKVTVQLTKGAQGLGFKLAARDNYSTGEFSPIYIKNILPKGAAITDGRLQRGDRLLQVNQHDMTQCTLHEAVNMLRNTKLGSTVELVVSRQMINTNSNQTINSTTKTELSPTNEKENFNELESDPKMKSNNQVETLPMTISLNRQILTYEIALNDTGSAGLGVSVKGKTKRIEEEAGSHCSVDLGIFVKTVINGGAASKDGRLKPNDQLLNINGFSLLGKSNEEAMLILRDAMQIESRPGHIDLTVSRKIKPTLSNHGEACKNTENVYSSLKTNEPDTPLLSSSQNDDINNKDVIIDDTNCSPEEGKPSNFDRDAPTRRSMSEKRTKFAAAPPPNYPLKNETTTKIAPNVSSLINKYQTNLKQQSSKSTSPSLIDENNPKEDHLTRVGSFDCVSRSNNSYVRPNNVNHKTLPTKIYGKFNFYSNFIQPQG
jgi:C-terminal processing protease CtpA/Prc